MKSILVDALRQANGEEAETKLSDSGSFDTTQEDFTATANQDIIDVGVEAEVAELELMATTRDLLVPDAGEDDEFPPPRVEDTAVSGAGWVTDRASVVRGNGSLARAPALARHVPLICVAAALLSAAGWLGYQHLLLQADAPGLGTVAMQSRAVPGQDEPLHSEAVAHRFRYLQSAHPLTPEGADQ